MLPSSSRAAPWTRPLSLPMRWKWTAHRPLLNASQLSSTAVPLHTPFSANSSAGSDRAALSWASSLAHSGSNVHSQHELTSAVRAVPPELSSGEAFSFGSARRVGCMPTCASVMARTAVLVAVRTVLAVADHAGDGCQSSPARLRLQQRCKCGRRAALNPVVGVITTQTQRSSWTSPLTGGLCALPDQLGCLFDGAQRSGSWPCCSERWTAPLPRRCQSLPSISGTVQPCLQACELLLARHSYAELCLMVDDHARLLRTARDAASLAPHARICAGTHRHRAPTPLNPRPARWHCSSVHGRHPLHPSDAAQSSASSSSTTRARRTTWPRCGGSSWVCWSRSWHCWLSSGPSRQNLRGCGTVLQHRSTHPSPACPVCGRTTVEGLCNDVIHAPPSRAQDRRSSVASAGSSVFDRVFEAPNPAGALPSVCVHE